jgi:hypothetical protein
MFYNDKYVVIKEDINNNKYIYMTILINNEYKKNTIRDLVINHLWYIFLVKIDEDLKLFK